MVEYATLVRDHVILTRRWVDRTLLKAYVPKLQSVGGWCVSFASAEGVGNPVVERRSARSATRTSPSRAKADHPTAQLRAAAGRRHQRFAFLITKNPSETTSYRTGSTFPRWRASAAMIARVSTGRDTSHSSTPSLSSSPSLQ
jgi:hypothetical protein